MLENLAQSIRNSKKTAPMTCNPFNIIPTTDWTFPIPISFDLLNPVWDKCKPRIANGTDTIQHMNAERGDNIEINIENIPRMSPTVARSFV